MEVDALLRWYRRTARELPWRSEPTPYHVLLSEFMCQQTRVETALPYFRRFVERWPTLAALAGATEDEVVEAWAGLGYYSRARRLHGVARAAVDAGGLPDTAVALAELPGIGPYTAGAIASIAFGEPVPAVDGNVNRVLARHRGITALVDRPDGKRAIHAAAAALHLHGAPPGDLNQALMELGATHCAPRRWDCEGCPVSSDCTARAEGRVADLPRKRPRRAAVKVEGVAGVVRRDGRVLVVKRAGRGLLGGLWTPPLVMEVPMDDRASLAAVLGAAGVRVDRIRPVATVRHIFSHRDLTLRVYEVDGEPTGAVGEPWTAVDWASPGRGLSTLARKIIAASDSAQADAPLLAADR
jgi:A/G-specific adenine glycosylase